MKFILFSQTLSLSARFCSIMNKGMYTGHLIASLIVQSVKESACNTGDLGSIPGLVRSPGEGKGNPLQYSCLENPMDRGAWQATVHGVPSVRHDLVTKEREILGTNKLDVV